MNSLTIIGYVGGDPETRVGNSGKLFSKFSVGVRRRFDKDTTDWFNVTCFEGNAKFVDAYLKKGNRVAVQGEFQQSSFTGQNGETVKTWSLLAGLVEILSDKKDRPEQSRQEEPRYRDSAPCDDLPF